jgi:hypothetical protein
MYQGTLRTSPPEVEKLPSWDDIYYAKDGNKYYPIPLEQKHRTLN